VRILIRNFNSHINSKSGSELPKGKVRGTDDWQKFEQILIDSLLELGHEVHSQEEHPTQADCPGLWDKKIRVHQTKNSMPAYDYYYMQIHCKDLFTFDPTGWGVEASGIKECTSYLEDVEDSRKFCQTLSDKFHASGISKCDQPLTTDFTPEKFILVPVQIPRDWTILHHSPITVKYFVESVAAWASDNNYHVCFKMHPFNRGDVELHEAIDYVASNSPYVRKVEGNIHELIKRSVGLFVINSGTGFEALIHGKPVATFGNCDYNRVSFNADIRRLDEARNFLYGWTPEKRDIAYQFCYWYYHRHAYCLSLPGTKERLKAYLKGVLV